MRWLRASLQFNNSYAFSKNEHLNQYQKIHQRLVPNEYGSIRSDVPRCGACGEIQDKWKSSHPGLVVKDREFDISITYDGILIVSKRFYSEFTRLCLSGLGFRQLPDDPSFYSAQATRAVTFDAERRQTRFLKQCPVCGIHQSIIGATPIFLEPKNYIGDCEFVKTDIEFGSGDEKSPLLICGGTAANALSSSKLRGLNLIEFEPFSAMDR